MASDTCLAAERHAASVARQSRSGVNAFVILQRVDVLERLAAYVAFVAPLVRVDALVPFEVRNLVEPLSTRCTTERLCKRVQDLVIAQVLFCRKPLATDLALVLLNARVTAYMMVEAALAAERLRTRVALPRQYVSVGSLVLFEIPALGERPPALLTGVLPFSGVRSFVSAIIGRRLELLVADVAQVRFLSGMF